MSRGRLVRQINIPLQITGDVDQVAVALHHHHKYHIRFKESSVTTISHFFRWTRPPEEGERTDNEDQDDVDEDAVAPRGESRDVSRRE